MGITLKQLFRNNLNLFVWTQYDKNRINNLVQFRSDGYIYLDLKIVVYSKTEDF